MSTERLHPKITISKDIINGTAPYSVDVDEQGIESFLSSRGAQSTDFPNLRIRVTSKDLEEAANTVYEDKTDVKIEVSAGYAWKQYQKTMKAASDISDGKKSSNKPFRQFLYTKRLPKYLQTAPKERGLKTARRLLKNGVSRELNGSLIHELVHAGDIFTGKHKFWYGNLGVAFSNLLDFARYRVDVSEREAARFEKEKRNDLGLRNILTFSPKQ